MPYGVTPRQKELLDFIHGYWRANGRMPRLRTCAVWLGLTSTGAVRQLVMALRERGHLVMSPEGDVQPLVIPPAPSGFPALVVRS